MTLRCAGALLTALVGFAMSSPAQAQQSRLRVAIMPATYFSADQASADNITQGLVEQFERAGYEVISLDNSRSKFQGMGLSRTQHYSDMTAARFGRELGADLVAHPRLLALGIPLNDKPNQESLFEPAAVMHLRVLNVHSKAPIYFRQIAHEYRTDVDVADADFQLPTSVASQVAAEASQMYFDRVAGSRQEIRGRR